MPTVENLDGKGLCISLFSFKWFYFVELPQLIYIYIYLKKRKKERKKGRVVKAGVEFSPTTYGCYLKESHVNLINYKNNYIQHDSCNLRSSFHCR
jgi:hypothetical protein